MLQSKEKILFVDNHSKNLTALETILKDVDAELVSVTSGNEALKAILNHDFALAVLDIQMQDMDVYELARLIRSRIQTRHLPIIFLSAVHMDDFYILKGYESGGVDFLTKPFEPSVLKNKIDIFLELYRQRKKLEEANERIAAQNQQLEERVRRDSLTGLYNHAHYQKELKREFDLAIRHNDPLSVLMCDLDHFKDVNDHYGHQVGDLVLKEFAAILRQLTRDSDLVARYGGEEFVLALPHTNIGGGRGVGEKIRSYLESNVFQFGETKLQVTVSVGVASLTQEHKEALELIEQADNALYKAKENGRNMVCVFQNFPESSRDEPFPGDDCFKRVRNELLKSMAKKQSAALASFETLVESNFRGCVPMQSRNARAIHLADLLGKKLNLPQDMMQSFRRSLKLHDLFRLYMRDSTFANQGALSIEEKQLIFNQPLLMKELTDLFDLFADERRILLYHHERYDGSGYPEGLTGDEIPFGARIFAMVDSIIAMRYPMYRRNGISLEKLKDEIKKQAGKQFDPFLVDCVLELLESVEFQ